MRVHNQLFEEREREVERKVQRLWVFGWALAGVVILALTHTLVDYWLSARYMLRIEKQVGMLLLQFVIVSDSEVVAINKLIDKFCLVVLNLAPDSPPPAPTEADDSHNELIPTGKALLPNPDILGRAPPPPPVLG